jgi:hypothetical protein
MIGQSIGIGLVVIGLVWAVGHLALIYYALRLRLIQRVVGTALFVAAVVQATVSVGGIALLVVMPVDFSMSHFKLLVILPPLLAGALALLSLSARRAGPRPSTPYT